MKRTLRHLLFIAAGVVFANCALAQQEITTHGSSFHRRASRQFVEGAYYDILPEIPATYRTYPTNYDIIRPQILRPDMEPTRMVKGEILRPTILIPRTTVPDSIRPTILEKFRVDKPDTIKPDYDTNVRLFRGYDFRVDRLQVSGTCAYCKTGLYGNHRYHTDRSVLVTEEAQPLRPIEERVRELMPTYNPEATNRFERVRPIPIYKPDYGANQ